MKCHFLILINREDGMTWKVSNLLMVALIYCKFFSNFIMVKFEYSPANGTLALWFVFSFKRSSVTVRISFQSTIISSIVVLGDVTVNLITYCPFRLAGTQWILPLALSFFQRVSVMMLSPISRKTTNPKCLVPGNSKRLSPWMSDSNLAANLTPCKHYLDRYIIFNFI